MLDKITYLNLSKLISTYLKLSNILIYMDIPNYDSGDKLDNGFTNYINSCQKTHLGCL